MSSLCHKCEARRAIKCLKCNEHMQYCGKCICQNVGCNECVNCKQIELNELARVKAEFEDYKERTDNVWQEHNIKLHLQFNEELQKKVEEKERYVSRTLDNEKRELYKQYMEEQNAMIKLHESDIARIQFALEEAEDAKNELLEELNKVNEQLQEALKKNEELTQELYQATKLEPVLTPLPEIPVEKSKTPSRVIPSKTTKKKTLTKELKPFRV